MNMDFLNHYARFFAVMGTVGLWAYILVTGLWLRSKK